VPSPIDWQVGNVRCHVIALCGLYLPRLARLDRGERFMYSGGLRGRPLASAGGFAGYRAIH
jgi:hypothetical protein